MLRSIKTTIDTREARYSYLLERKPKLETRMSNYLSPALVSQLRAVLRGILQEVLLEEGWVGVEEEPSVVSRLSCLLGSPQSLFPLQTPGALQGGLPLPPIQETTSPPRTSVAR